MRLRLCFRHSHRRRCDCLQLLSSMTSSVDQTMRHSHQHGILLLLVLRLLRMTRLKGDARLEPPYQHGIVDGVEEAEVSSTWRPPPALQVFGLVKAGSRCEGSHITCTLSALPA